MIVRVKICGTTRLEDALVAAEAGADALGFIFFESSPRHIKLSAVADIVKRLPPFIARVGVFVNPREEFVRQAIDVGIDTLQFHGEESPAFCRGFGLRTYKAFRVKDSASLKSIREYDVSAWLLDTAIEGAHGGTGKTFNWNLAVEAKKLGRPVILAGGLTPDNVADAIQQVAPYAVDVSSGVESAPGHKDHQKTRLFINRARDAAARLERS